MIITFKDLTDKLGVGYELSAFETCPWSAFDDEKGESVNAEVRMDSTGEELEAELQFMRDNPKGDEKPMEQVMYLMARPSHSHKWDIKLCKIKGEINPDDLYDWEGKCLAFFGACVQDLKMGKMPDIEEILEREIKSKERFGDKGRGAGSKSPKMRNQNKMGMKQGR